MDDLISRQAAIDAIANCTNCGDEKTLRAYVAKHNLDNGWTGGVLDAIDAIEELPSAQPERTGKWIRHPEQRNIYGGKTIECSECQTKYVVQYIEDEKYCRNCGARMEK